MASFAPIRGTRAQIQTTPIVDGQFLVETDQGVDNKIYMDEGSTRTIVGGNTVTGVLPELYIYSETGSVVTVEDEGGTLIPTSQVGTDHWVCEVPDYGVYTVYSLLDGETTTQSINVTDCMIYTIDDSHFHCNVVVTYPSGVGASCQISGGGETYSAPSLNPPDTSYKFVVHGKNTTYTITTNVDGAIKTQTVTTGTVLDQTYNVTVPYARVNLTVEMPPLTGNVTCTDGTTTITKTATPNMVFYLSNTGTWTFTGSDGIDTYDTTVEITDLDTVYEADLSSAPNGATALPTDDIQTWLLCAKIKDKSYTTLEEVLADQETLQKLISNENACNYMVRSKTWIGYNGGLVPIMTSNTAPSGEVTTNYKHSNREPYMAFDGQVPNFSTGQHYWYAYTVGNYLQYEFPTAHIIKRISLGYINSNSSVDGVLKLQGSNDGFNSDINDLQEITLPYRATSSSYYTVDLSFDNDVAYKYFRLIITSYSGGSSSIGIGLCFVQVYEYGITNNDNAMRYIGEKNYASNTLLADSDWGNAIVNSEYTNYILNGLVPKMTSNTTPSGEASASNVYSSSYAAYNAFNDDHKKFVDWNTSHWQTANDAKGSAGQWLKYDFGVAVKADMIAIMSGTIEISGSYYAPLKTYKIQGSNDNFVSDIQDLVEKVNPNDRSINSSICLHHLTNTGSYRYYRLLSVDDAWTKDGSATYGNIGVFTLQYYSREDVDETVYHVYSAANDLIAITGDGISLTCQTDPNGYGTIAKSSLPNGTYTFTSSVAKNPSDLSVDYFKSITITNNTIDVLVMPDNTFYWWGYMSDAEICDSSWTRVGGSGSAYTRVNSTPSTQYIPLRSGGSQWSGFGTNNPIPIGKTAKIIDTGVTIADSQYGTFITSPSKYIKTTDLTTSVYSAINTASLKLYSVSISTSNKYAMIESIVGRTSNLSAMWYED